MEVSVERMPAPEHDAFLRASGRGRICYTYRWGEAASQAAGLHCFYLVARDGKGVRGVLPLIHVKSILFGNFMVSQGFNDYGGIIADCDEARDMLFRYSVDLAIRKDCRTIEYRNTEPLPYDLEDRTGKVTMHLRLDSDPEKVWRSLGAKVRNQIRKAGKSGIVASEGRSELLEEFYDIYSTRMHQLGSPAHPKRLMRRFLDAFPENCRLFVVRLNSLAIGGGLTFHFNGFVEMPFAGTNARYNSLCPNYALYWSVIKHYCLAGEKCFDFGRCSMDSPTYHFKKQWGPERITLFYQYWVSHGEKLSILSPENPKYKRRVEIWKKLPLFMARFLGPYVSRNLP